MNEKTTLIIYGASDDLIEVEGLLYDELNLPYGKPATVLVKVDDTIWAKVPIEYGKDGIWHIWPGAIYAPVEFVPARGDGEPDDEDGCPGYSDKVTIDMSGIEARRVNLALTDCEMSPAQTRVLPPDVFADGCVGIHQPDRNPICAGHLKPADECLTPPGGSDA